MKAEQVAKRIEFLVSWPVQGASCFRSHESELVLSDVYWRWIFEALSEGTDGDRLPFVEAVEDGFCDPRNLMETIPVTPAFLDRLRRVSPSRAPSFELLIPAEGTLVPAPEEILAEFTRLVGEALPSGSMEMEIE